MRNTGLRRRLRGTVAAVSGLLVAAVGLPGTASVAGAEAPPGPYFAEAEATPLKGDFGNGDLALGDGAAALTVARVSDTPDAFAKAFAMYPGFFAYFTLYPGAAGGGGLPLPPLPGAVEIQRSGSGSEQKDATIHDAGQADQRMSFATSRGDVNAELPRALGESEATDLKLPNGVTIGFLRSSSLAGTDKLDLVARAVAVAENVKIGALTIDSMRLWTEVRRVAADGKLVINSDVKFIGAKVNDIPVEISPFGVTAGPGGAPGPGDRSVEVQEALKASGLKHVRGGRVERIDRDGYVEVRRDALSFRYHAPEGPYGQEYGGGALGTTLVRLGGSSAGEEPDE